MVILVQQQHDRVNNSRVAGLGHAEATPGEGGGAYALRERVPVPLGLMPVAMTFPLV